jgi:hypothetical protein
VCRTSIVTVARKPETLLVSHALEDGFAHLPASSIDANGPTPSATVVDVNASLASSNKSMYDASRDDVGGEFDH